jgi:hypothetical protein
VIFRSWLVAPPVGLRFDETMLVGGSDGEFFMRASRHGARILRTADAVVFEHRPASRATLAHECRRAYRVGANCNYRYRKHHAAPTALVRLLARATEKVLVGAGRLVAAAVLVLLSFRKSVELARKSAADACFACGCLGPYFGLTPHRYH